jgi:hypothetical protein
MVAEQPLRALANKLGPVNDLSAINSAVAHALISTLNQLPLPEGIKVSRSRIAGSQGKRTSLANSDIDFVRFASSSTRPDLLPPEGTLTLLRLTQEQLLNSRLNLRVKGMSAQALFLEVGGISVDLLYARDFAGSDQTVAAQACGALEYMRSTGVSKKLNWSWGTAFTEVSMCWLKAQTSILCNSSSQQQEVTLLRNTVRLVKHRMLNSRMRVKYGDTVVRDLPAFAKQHGISSHLIEVLVVYIANRAYTRAQKRHRKQQRKHQQAHLQQQLPQPKYVWQLSMTRTLQSLHWLVQKPAAKVRVHFPPEKWVDVNDPQVAALVAPGSLFVSVHGGELGKRPRKTQQRAVILDPANPLCNLAEAITPEGWQLLQLLTAPDNLLCEVRLDIQLLLAMCRYLY